MSNFFDFSSTKINIFLILLDSSGSMSGDRENVRKGLQLFKESFEGFYLANSIVVSVCSFDNNFYSGDFLPVKQMDTSYSIGGSTALNYALVCCQELLSKYVREVVSRTGVSNPNVTFVCMSDGQPYMDRRDPEDGMAAIRNMNYAGVTTAFAALGDEVNAEFGQEMGFTATVDVTDRSALLRFLGVELSNSCKEQSQSRKSLGANFFSQANKGMSQEYSQTAEQALEDNSWIYDI